MDWVLIVLVLLFCIRGMFRGAVTQVFALLGLILGLWALSLTAQWVGEHWKGARPTVLFLLLRWIVAAMAGAVVIWLVTWAGELLGKTVREGPLGWLDRSIGFFVGGLVGAACALLLVFGVLRLPDVVGLVPPVAHARLTKPILTNAFVVCGRGVHSVPGCRWIGQQLQLAMDRADGRKPAVTHTRRT